MPKNKYNLTTCLLQSTILPRVSPRFFILRYTMYMKTILVDAMHTIINTEGVLDKKIYELLEQYQNPKIIVTNMQVNMFQRLAMDLLPYPVFTLSKQPSKLETQYFEILMEEYNLFPSECIYFEHNKQAIASAESIGITSYYFDSEKRDIQSLQEFLKNNL